MADLGSILRKRYRIKRVLGEGGFGKVYLADDQRLKGKPVAIKELKIELASAKKAFEQETDKLAILNHSGIPRVSDAFSENGHEYLVMDYIPGETLEKRLEKQPSPGFPEEQVLEWAKQLTDMLAYLHNQNPPIIFRDLKPSNIMIQLDGQLKLIDFGIARHFKPGQSRDTLWLGTLGYAAPEQHGSKQTDARSDVYSLGVVLHELLTKHDPSMTPLDLPAIASLNAQVSPHVIAAIEKALNYKPEERFQDIYSFAAALNKKSKSTPVPPTEKFPDPDHQEPSPNPVFQERAPKLPFRALLTLLTIVIAFGVFWWFSSPVPVSIAQIEVYMDDSPLNLEELPELTGGKAVVLQVKAIDTQEVTHEGQELECDWAVGPFGTTPEINGDECETYYQPSTEHSTQTITVEVRGRNREFENETITLTFNIKNE